jgi:hypothetical protein
VVFDRLVQVLVFSASYTRVADASCSATTIRSRRDEWIAAGVFQALHNRGCSGGRRVGGWVGVEALRGWKF